MILKKLKIENFGNIRRFETSFDSLLAVVSNYNADDIIKAIGVVTNNKTLTGRITKQMLSVDTNISAELKIDDEPFLINARAKPSYDACEYESFEMNSMESINPEILFGSIRLCEEEESLTYYRFNRKNIYSERFLHYKDPDKYYSPGEFRKITEGTGTTRSFRACLSEYIREYKPDSIPLGEYKIDILSDGRFVGYSANAPNEVMNFNEEDIRLFDYMCYLDVNNFWSRFEDIRNMNHEKWPMIVDATDLVKSLNYFDLVGKSSGLGRQLILKGAGDMHN